MKKHPESVDESSKLCGVEAGLGLDLSNSKDWWQRLASACQHWDAWTHLAQLPHKMHYFFPSLLNQITVINHPVSDTVYLGRFNFKYIIKFNKSISCMK